MTTQSFATIRRMALELLATERPDLKVRSLQQERIGPSIRLVKCHFVDGSFIQFPMPPLGTHAQALARAVVEGLTQGRPKP